MWLSDELIEQAKRKVRCQSSEPLHEHNDCIRMAYHWLDAQPKTKALTLVFPIKTLVERWAGRYVSRSDVEVAAYLHPEIEGQYPYFNISRMQLTEPSVIRLKGIPEAFQHSYREYHSPEDYKRHEV